MKRIIYLLAASLFFIALLFSRFKSGKQFQPEIKDKTAYNALSKPKEHRTSEGLFSKIKNGSLNDLKNLFDQLLKLPNGERKSALFALLFQRWALLDEQGLRDHLYDQDYGFYTAHHYGKELTTFAHGNEDLSFQTELMELGAAGWSKVEPREAIDWLQSIADGDLKSLSMTQVALVTAENGLPISTEAISLIDNEELLSAHGFRFGLSLGAQNQKEIAPLIDKFSQKIEQPGYRQIWESFYVTWARNDIENALKQLATSAESFPKMIYAGNDIAMELLETGEFPHEWLSSLHKGELKTKFIDDFVDVYSKSAPLDTWNTLIKSQLPVTAETIQTLTSNWYANDRDGLYETYAKLDEAPSEVFINGVIQGISRNNLVEAIQTAQEYENLSLQEDLISGAIETFQSHGSATDPWESLANNTELSVANRDRLLRALISEEQKLSTDLDTVIQRVTDLGFTDIITENYLTEYSVKNE